MRTNTHPSKRRQAGFSLVEIMVVVIILGVLAATIVPKFAGTTHDAKVSAAKSHIANYENALERFNLAMDRYPTEEEGLDALVNPPADGDGAWRGPYIKEVIKDPWGMEYQYSNPGTQNFSFDVWSRGADKVDGGEGKDADIGNWSTDGE